MKRNSKNIVKCNMHFVIVQPNAWCTPWATSVRWWKRHEKLQIKFENVNLFLMRRHIFLWSTFCCSFIVRWCTQNHHSLRRMHYAWLRFVCIVISAERTGITDSSFSWVKAFACFNPWFACCALWFCCCNDNIFLWRDDDTHFAFFFFF